MFVTSSRSVAGILRRAATMGLDPSRLAAAADLSPSVPDVQPWVSTTRLLALHEAAARLSGDEAFGLHLAEALTRETFASLSASGGAAVTVGEAMARVAQRLRCWTNAAQVEIRAERDTWRVEYRLLNPTPAVRQDAEATLGMFVAFARAAAAPGAVREIAFTHARARSLGEHDRILGAPLRFDCPANAVTFDRERLQERLDPEALRHEPESSPPLPAVPPPVTFLDRVARVIAAALDDGEATLGAVAGRLGMSARSLQRRLAERGSSYEESLDAIRRQLCLVYLNAGDHPGEIAARLGYSERSPFYRAFRRWTGTTPADFVLRPPRVEPRAR